MTEKIPYEVIVGRIKSDVDYVAKEAYRSGIDDQATEDTKTIERLIKDKEEAYQKGYDEAWVNVGECEDRVAKQAYQKGLDDAWETARKIVVDPENGGYTYDQLEEVFDTRNIHKILCNMTPSEVLAKLQAYEQQKADDIKVGDIITDGKINYLVIDITDKSYVALQGTDFEPVYIGKDYIGLYHNLNDHKDMQKIAEEINNAMKVMKGEQRNCSTCKYIHNILMCNTCINSSKWVQKEGAE